MTKHIYLVRGVPGSGKSYYANHKLLAWSLVDVIHEADDFFHTSPDGVYRFDGSRIKDAHASCQTKVRTAMQLGLNIAVANTFTQMWEMEPYKEMAKEFGYTVHVHTCHGNYPNVHGVPDETVQRMRDRFEH